MPASTGGALSSCASFAVPTPAFCWRAARLAFAVSERLPTYRLVEHVQGVPDPGCRSLLEVATSFVEDARQLHRGGEVPRNELLALCDRYS